MREEEELHRTKGGKLNEFRGVGDKK